MRKLSMILMALLLSATLIACAKTAPAPAPAPAPTVTVTAPAAPTVTVTAPAPAPTPKPTPSVKHEVTQINIYSLTLGATAYVLGFALADQINKHSDWLRAVPIETTGATENVQLASREGNRKNSILNLAIGSFYDSREGRDVFKGKPYKFTILSNNFPWQNAIVTLNPNIKNFEDLAGKRVSPAYAPGITGDKTFRFFAEKLGMLDKVNVSYLSYAKMKDALIDGTIDAAFLPLSGFLPKFVPNPATEELLAAKKVYSVHHPATPEVEAEMQRAVMIPFGFKTIPKTADPRLQNDWLVTESVSTWAASPELPDDVVAEVLRILWEYRNEIKNYHAVAEGYSLQGLVDVYAEAKSFHPAALKFWTEKGAKITYKEPW
ncbi:MAG: TAXI family TRAP transporter solute-binding subunit [Chloroflexi bacterium]|nr:TAXI family TRAP transporter solute-binding subunit [Chloroflexota bacterium]